jgi:hypothetical protein
MQTKILQFCLCAVALFALSARAETINPKSQEKIDKYIVFAKELAADPEIVKAVAAQNAQVPAGYAEMTQEKWTAMADTDPFLRTFTKNPAAATLKNKRIDGISEAFLSDERGVKVAFLAKTTNWSHAGKPKHDLPMAGKTWQGKLELDKSAGTMEVQIAVPVLKDGKPIGSLVLGLNLEAFTMD